MPSSQVIAQAVPTRPSERRSPARNTPSTRAASSRPVSWRTITARRLPRSLERIFGADADLWRSLLVIVPILTVGLSLTVGLRVDGLPRVDNDYWWHLATGDWIL